MRAFGRRHDGGFRHRRLLRGGRRALEQPIWQQAVLEVSAQPERKTALTQTKQRASQKEEKVVPEALQLTQRSAKLAQRQKKHVALKQKLASQAAEVLEEQQSIQQAAVALEEQH